MVLVTLQPLTRLNEIKHGNFDFIWAISSEDAKKENLFFVFPSCPQILIEFEAEEYETVDFLEHTCSIRGFKGAKSNFLEYKVSKLNKINRVFFISDLTSDEANFKWQGLIFDNFNSIKNVEDFEHCLASLMNYALPSRDINIVEFIEFVNFLKKNFKFFNYETLKQIDQAFA